MSTKGRHDQIVRAVDEQGFLSVAALSHLCGVTEMTIRRDLAHLGEERRILRIYGGATSLRRQPAHPADPEETGMAAPTPGSLVERVDVLIATSVNPKYDGALLERIARKNIPIVAESQAIDSNEETLVSVDNYQAGFEMGQWAGQYAIDHYHGSAHALDLTTHLINATARSRGFIAGLQQALPTAGILSLDAQSRFDTAYQLTLDALTVHQGINLIYCTNDTLAMGAIRACCEMAIPPDQMTILPFGLEGNKLKDLLVERPSYVRAGVAMFPEIVGPCCIEASIAACNHQPLPSQLVTPHIILTPQTVFDFYLRAEDGWRLRWDTVDERLPVPVDLAPGHWAPGTLYPRRIGFIIPFSEHEWYQNLAKTMREHASHYGIEYEIVDVEHNLKEEVDQRRRLIAQIAAEQVKDNEVILIDGGPIACYLAEMLAERQGLTIITNSIPVFELLKRSTRNTLICTGGAYRSSTQLFVGPTAESALRELRADKLFLTVTGITLNFGLSHTNISEVTIKQAMIRSARQVILLADTTYFGVESVIQVAPLSVVHKLITDDALPASTRLDLNKIGIHILLASG